MERLKLVGQVKAKTAQEVTTSRLGIGFEKLDRNVTPQKPTTRWRPSELNGYVFNQAGSERKRKKACMILAGLTML